MVIQAMCMPSMFQPYAQAWQRMTYTACMMWLRHSFLMPQATSPATFCVLFVIASTSNAGFDTVQQTSDSCTLGAWGILATSVAVNSPQCDTH